MKIKHGMILAAGFGKRMQPLTLKTPKPLIKVGSKTLLDRSLKLLLDLGVEEISVNIHYLGNQIEDYISIYKSKANIKISNEKDLLLDTGGGVKKGAKRFNENPFFVINPDTLWNSNYIEEAKNLEKLYLKFQNPCLLLVKKDLSLDKSFSGDFNLSNGLITKDKQNNLIFTGLQIMKNSYLNFIEQEVFSMNLVWDKLINEKKLKGLESKHKFYHLNSFKMFEQITNIKSIN